jgi:Protein of unknown function (DUF3343)
VTATDVVLLFASNSATMIATKTLRDAGVRAKMLPTPAGAAAGANLCLSIDAADEAKAVAALRGANVSPSSVLR